MTAMPQDKKKKKRNRRNKPVSPQHATYQKLHQFRLEWEATGSTRGELRKARKMQGTLYPTQG